MSELQLVIKNESDQIPNEKLIEFCDPIASRYQQCLNPNGYQFENKH